jgi:hypothetical protein
MIVVVAIVIVIVQTSVCQEIVDHRRSRAGIDIGR